MPSVANFFVYLFRRSLGISSSKHCSIASVDANGNPHVTPIGFVFLRNDGTGYYFEQYSKQLPQNYETNRNVCLMAVNSGFTFWFKSLLNGRFESFPGVRLHGIVDDIRKATPGEVAELKRRIGAVKFLSGARQIWSDLETVRDISFYGVEPVKYPKMMHHLTSFHPETANF